jgi:hypothetical protein
MSEDETKPDGPRISEAKRVALEKARAARAAKRKERGGPTPAEAAARKRMLEGAAAKRERDKRIREGKEKPVARKVDGGPEIDAAPYPAAPERSAPATTDEAPAVPPVASGASSIAPAGADTTSPAEPTRPATTNTNEGIGAWLRRAMGL